MNSSASLLAHDLSTLRVVQKHGPASLALLRRAEPRPVPAEPLLDRLSDLVGFGLLQRSRKQRGGPVLYALSKAGASALRKHDGAPAPAPAPAAVTVAPPAPCAPRYFAKAGNYDGAELRPYTGRPGALDAYRLPSVVNGRQVERVRAPIIVGGTKPDRVRDGRGR